MPADRQRSSFDTEPRIPWWRRAVRPALDAEDPLVRYLLRAIPGAGVYYLTAVPRLLLNPIGTVRRGVRDQPLDAFGPRTLIAFAFPPLLLGVVLAAIPGIILTALYGDLRADAIILLLIQAVAAFIAAVASGFLLHPALGWLVALMGGESDNVSRTNCFVTLLTALPLAAAAVGIAPLGQVIPVPFFGVGPPLLVLAAAVLLLYVSYVWLEAFAVSAGIPIAVVILIAASVVGTGFPVVQAVRAGLGAVAADGNPVPEEAASDAEYELREYQRRRAQIEEALRQNPSLIFRAGVKKSYAKLTSETIRIRRASGDDAKADRKIYAATAVHVDRLYGILFVE